MIGGRQGVGDAQVWIAVAPVDMRKSFDGLAEVVRSFLGHDPLSGSMFVFRNKSSQRVKILGSVRQVAHIGFGLGLGAEKVWVPPRGNPKNSAAYASIVSSAVSAYSRRRSVSRYFLVPHRVPAM